MMTSARYRAAAGSALHPDVAALTPAELTAVVQKYCVVCHNDAMLTGNLSPNPG